jgi:hypothetical protein
VFQLVAKPLELGRLRIRRQSFERELEPSQGLGHPSVLGVELVERGAEFRKSRAERGKGTVFAEVVGAQVVAEGEAVPEQGAAVVGLSPALGRGPGSPAEQVAVADRARANSARSSL